jgi:hypothetical protein
MHLDLVVSKLNASKMIEKMLTHIHMVMLAHLRRQWSLSGRDGFGTLSPSRLASLAGFGAFCRSDMHIFHYAGGRDFL